MSSSIASTAKPAPYNRKIERTIEIGFVCLILLLAALLRFWRIDSLPPGFHLDESFEGLEAWRILNETSYRPVFLTGNFGVPPLNAYVNALMFALVQWLGGAAGPTAMRASAATIGVISVAALYFCAKELQLLLTHSSQQSSRPYRWLMLSPAFPALAAASLAVMRWHLHFSRMGIEPIFVPLWWTLALGLCLRAWRTWRWHWFALCALVLAAAMYTYQGAWVIPLLMIPTAVLLLWAAPLPAPSVAGTAVSFARRQLGKRLLFSALLAALCILPLVRFFWQQPALLLLRPTQIAVVGAGEAAVRENIWAEVWATAKMFGPLGLPGDFDPRRNLPGWPALDPWQAAAFYAGLVCCLYACTRQRQGLAYALILIGLIGLLLPGIFSEYAPHFHRILGAAAPTALLCGVGLDLLWKLAAIFSDNQRSRLHVRLLRGLAVLLLTMSGITTADAYFVRWASLPDLYYAFDVGLWQIGRWQAEQPASSPVYLSPRTLEHPTLAFALQSAERQRPAPISFDGRHAIPLTAHANPSPEVYVVIEKEDFRSHLLLPELFPNVNIEQTWRDANGDVYANAYLRPAQSLPDRSPSYPLAQRLGDGIQLAGYDVQQATLPEAEMLYLQLHWQVESQPSNDWTVFTHLVDTAAPEGAPLTGYDSRPGSGALPTPRWQPGWRVLDEYQIRLPDDLPAGRYALRIGLYDASSARLPSQGNGVQLEGWELKR